MPYAYVLVAAGSILWCAPFIFAGAKRRVPFRVDRRSRWGVALECLGYSLLWQEPFWTRSPESWRVIAAVLLFALGCVVSWTGTRALGMHFRVDAAVDASHELVRSGPYRYVRHPIYTSMLCVLLGTGLMISTLPLLFSAAVVVFLAGTEIRIRVEDRLLESQLGEQFREYRRSVPALIPFVSFRRD
ncbi:MAG: methyltransferase family protein [Capsulimonadaceae bacterium]